MSSVQEYQAALRERRDFFASLDQRVAQQIERIEADIAHLVTLETRNRRELAAYLLADIDDESLGELEQTLRYPALLSIKRRFEAQLDEAQARIEAMGADPRVEHLELERRDLADQQVELAPAWLPLQRAHEAWLSSLYFYELRDRGWFDPRYEPDGYFTRFRDWRAVSLLMEDLDERLDALGRDEEFDDDDELRAAFNTHLETWTSVREAVEGIEQRQSAAEALAAEWAAAQARPRALFDEMFQALADAVLDHLDSCPESLRFQLARQDEHLTVFLKKAAGLARQISYLRQLRVVRLDNWKERAQREVAKLDRKITKVQNKIWRGKYIAVTADDVASARRTKADKWGKRLDRFDTTRERIASFTSYQKGSFTEDYLWWDVMTGRAKANDIYEVTTFRREHPDWDHRHYRAPWDHGHHDHDDDRELVDEALDTAAGALAAQSLLEDGGGDDDTLFSDVS